MIETGQNKKITVELCLFMWVFSRGKPRVLSPGPSPGLKGGCTPAENIFWGDIQFFGHVKMTCERSLVVLWAAVCELRPELRCGGCVVEYWEYNPM